MRRLFIRLAGLLAVLLLTAPAGQAAVVADTGKLGSRVTAWGGYAAWNTWSPETRRWSLSIFHDGVVTRAAPASRRGPFDADLGPSRLGRPAVVYTGCTAGNRCGILEYDVLSRKERVLRASSSEFYETSPTIWRDRLAFTRVTLHPRLAREALTRIYIWRRGHKPELQPGGSAGKYEQLTPGQYTGADGAGSLDLRSDQLLHGWNYQSPECPHGEKVDVPTNEIWLAHSGTHRLLERDTCTAESYAFHPAGLTASGAFMTFKTAEDLEGATHYRRVSLPSGRSADVRLFGDIQSAAQDGATTYYVRKRDLVMENLSLGP